MQIRICSPQRHENSLSSQGALCLFILVRRTIAKEVACEGVALHAGSRVRARLLPADAGRGIVFRREDLGDVEIPARYDRVGETHLGTAIAENGASVSV